MIQSSLATTSPDDGLQMRRPTANDGHAVHELIGRCPPLDPNSIYCNLLQCTHFSETCVLATSSGAGSSNEAVMGFVSAYLIPKQPEALFVWQVAVAPEARNRGLGRRMLMDLLGRPVCEPVRYLKTTITETNDASWSLFEALARRFQAPLERQPLFDRERHFHGAADSETLVTIGPFPSRS